MLHPKSLWSFDKTNDVKYLILYKKQRNLVVFLNKKPKQQLFESCLNDNGKFLSNTKPFLFFKNKHESITLLRI